MRKSIQAGRWAALALTLVLLAAAGVQLANPHSYLSEVVARIGETGSGPDANLTDLNLIGPLQSAFNADAGRPRLILLLSPT